jgi:hypothetical protein
VFATVQQFRGNSFAQTVVAAVRTLRKPNPDEAHGTKQGASHPPTDEKPTEARDPAAQKIIERQNVAAWDQMSRAPLDENHAPSVVRLPDSVVEQIDRAWKDSVGGATEIEQGGNLVRTYGGKYKLRRGSPQGAGEFQPEANDVGWGESNVAVVHTHPYRDEEQVGTWPTDYGTFSTADLWEIINDDQPLNILRSGPYTFMIARTRQFNQLVAQHEAADTLNDLAIAISRTSDTTYKDARAQGMSTPDSLERAVLAVCDTYHLVYYEGTGAELHRASKNGAS